MSSELKYWYLHEHKLFKNLSYTEINDLCILKKFKKSKKNEIVDLPFSEKNRIYFLKKGTIKLIKISDNGDEVLLDFIQNGDLFGELSLDNSVNNNEFMQVVSDEAIICTFYQDKLEEIMQTKPDFALNYIKFIGFNYKKMQNSYKNILFKDSRTRLLLLLKIIIEKEGIEDTSFTLPNFLTQHDIAQLICTTRQTIITLFKELEKEGILQYTQKQIHVPDIEKIKRLTENVK